MSKAKEDKKEKDMQITKAAREIRDPESERALFALVKAIAIGLAGIVIYSFDSSSISQFFSFVTIGILVAATSLSTGGLLGFLFGIPRTLQREGLSSSSKLETTSNQDELINYLPNTNLEQISDWLTKILVGVGLTQIPKITEKLNQVALLVASGLGNSSGSKIFALAIILFFGICGFLFGYLWTRLYLLGAIRKADIGALAIKVDRANKEVQQVNRKLFELEKQTELDAIALSLVQRQLNPSIDIPPVIQEQLDDAIKATSRPFKVQIFNQAQDIRSENWKLNKPKMELTIPIFEALIKADVENKFHRNHAQLGYALKDKEKPHWEKAESELTKAIELRGNWRDTGWLFYEFNRAVCNINLDKDFLNGQSSKPEIADKILNDLKAVSQSNIKKLLSKEEAIKQWASKNMIDVSNLV